MVLALLVSRCPVIGSSGVLEGEPFDALDAWDLLLFVNEEEDEDASGPI